MSEMQLFLLAGAAIGVLLLWWALSLKKTHSLKRIARRAQRGEEGAEALLIREGYSIISRQECAEVRMDVDGETHKSFVRVDLIVSKDGRNYLVEVKTGKQANVDLPNVRRQLFEYRHIFNTDGILFVDMNNESVSEISFETEDAGAFPISIFLAGVFCGIILAIFIQSFF